jgi:hypothetical protein
LIFMGGLNRDDVAVLNALARELGEKLGWELHFQAAADPEFAGLTAGAGHTFITGPTRVSDLDRESIVQIFDALRRGTRRIVADANGDPMLTPDRENL